MELKTLSAELSQKIVKAVDSSFEDQISFTQELVKIPSQMREEEQAQQLVENALRNRGCTIDKWELNEADLENHDGFSPVEGGYDGKAVNVVGTHEPKSQVGRSLILNGHIDVVPVGPLEQWDSDPYDPFIKGDWMYGRGSGDMKAGLAANIFALDSLLHAGFRPAAPVHIQSVVEEECTGNGALACLVRGYNADAAIIPEPLGETMIRASTGIIWFRVKVLGKPAHPSTPTEGINAIDSIIGVIGALRKLEDVWNSRRNNHEHFCKLDRPIYMNVGKIRGGDWASSVPAWCTVDLRINNYPGIHPLDAIKEIEDCIHSYAAATPGLKDYPPVIEYPGHLSSGYALQHGSEAESVLRAAHEVSAGTDFQETVFTGYVDATIFTIYGQRPCLVYGPIAENIHSFNERVSLSSIKRVTKTIALFVAEWCGLEPV